MAKKPKLDLRDPKCYLNRELSLLEFQARVLEEAQDASNPLLERVKFACIVSSNLDEFFMVRVARLKRAIAAGNATRCPAGQTPKQQMRRVSLRCHKLVKAQYECVLGDLLPALAEHGLRVLHTQDLQPDQAAFVESLFDAELFPQLSPMAVDEARPFPLLSNLSLNFAVMLAPAEEGGKPRFAVVPLPTEGNRFRQVPSESGVTVLSVDDLIRSYLPKLFVGQQILAASVFRLTRDSELQFDDEGAPDFLHAVEGELRARRTNHPVRLEVEAAAEEALVAWLREQVDVKTEDVYRLPGPLDLRDLLFLVELPGHEELREEPFEPVQPAELHGYDSLFTAVRNHDMLLHHPYESFDPVIQLVSEAADDPDVLALKLTLYRTSGNSPIIAGLIRAVRNGKQVTALVELTARFDESRNVGWAKRLEEAGAHVIYGVRDLKTHAKILLVVRRDPDGVRRYLHLGTGNYNDRTARLYTDLGLLTTDPELGTDGSGFFNALTGYSELPTYQKLTMAPIHLRERLIELIDREAGRAAAGQPAEILAKMNSLVDPQIIQALFRASQAGVPIKLNVRGICCLRPGLRGVSNNIEVISIVDRYLEHSRVYYFRNGGDEEVYLSSADWMPRNLDRRVELMFPVEAPQPKEKALDILRTFFTDTVKARRLRADGKYVRVRPRKGRSPVRVQDLFQRRAQTAEDRAEYLTRTRFRPLRSNERMLESDAPNLL